MLKQLSVFLQNKAGRIADITRALSDAGIDLRALSIADTADFGNFGFLKSGGFAHFDKFSVIHGFPIRLLRRRY